MTIAIALLIGGLLFLCKRSLWKAITHEKLDNGAIIQKTVAEFNKSTIILWPLNLFMPNRILIMGMNDWMHRSYFRRALLDTMFGYVGGKIITTATIFGFLSMSMYTLLCAIFLFVPMEKEMWEAKRTKRRQEAINAILSKHA